MGWFTRTFGQCGQVKFRFELEDGRTYNAKIRIETFNIDFADLEAELRKIAEFESDGRVKNLEIVGWLED